LATGIPARLSPAEGRKFGLTVGGAFLVLTALLWWRGRMGIVPWFGGLGGLLVLAGLAVPTYLGPLNRAWMGLAHMISKVTTPIFMGVIYFLVITPVGVGMRLFGRRALVHQSGSHGFWFDRDAGKPDPNRMERQF
jgi:hypothetical protein